MTAARGTGARRHHGGLRVAGAVIGLAAVEVVTMLLRVVVLTASAVLGVSLGPRGVVPYAYTRPPSDPVEVPQLVGQGLTLAGVFVAFAVGGYVAARIARSDGAGQGVAVWAAGLVYGAALLMLVLSPLGGPGAVPEVVASLTPADLTSLLILLAVQLLGAVLGSRAAAPRRRRLRRPVDPTEAAPSGPVTSAG